MPENTFEPDWFSKPGDTLLSLMERKELTCGALAKRLNCSERKVRGLIAGTVGIDENLAVSLSRTVGGTKEFWRKRQSTYQQALTKVADSLSAETSVDWLRNFPVNDIAEYGWIKHRTKKSDRLKAYLAYFGVRNPKEWEARYANFGRTAAFRTSPTYQSKIGALSAWLRQAEIEASDVVTRSWNPTLLRQQIEQLRVLTKAKTPAYFLPRIRRLCAEAGVAVVFIRPPTGCRASGATRFLTPEKALVALSFRYLSDDHFWFTFFHEIAHVLLHSKSLTFVDVEKMSDGLSEEEANRFAANVLIPETRRDEMMDLPPSRDSIIRFAYSLGVSAGIVVGQMQHHGALKPNQLNFLKRRFDWKEIAAVLS